MIVTCAHDTLYKKISYKNIEAKFAKFEEYDMNKLKAQILRRI